MSDLEQLLVGLVAGISLVLILAGVAVAASLFFKYKDVPIPIPRVPAKPAPPQRELERAA